MQANLMSEDRIKELRAQLRQLDVERSLLMADIQSLEFRVDETTTAPIAGIQAQEKAPDSNNEKISLFLSLFRCRESVYPKLWENPKQNKKGYSPACNNEWVPGVCGKPPKGNVKCSECPHQAFPPLDDRAVKGHLQGLATIGTYAITEDNRCTFLAADFDGDGWASDVLAYKGAAQKLGVPVYVERSRSGDGAHAWIFFSEPIQARMARQLGTLIVSHALKDNHTLSLKTYDRFFPNQDTIPQGGFGNLIALPLQKKARESGNSVFIDDQLVPYPNQWEYLAQVRRLSFLEIDALMERMVPRPDVQFEGELFSMEVDERLMTLSTPKIYKGLYTGTVEIERGARLKISNGDIPGDLLAAFKKIAVFANPKFYARERMRYPTFPEPRFIFNGEVQPNCIILPRGVLAQCVELANEAGANVHIHDIRPTHKKLELKSSATLLPYQAVAVEEMKKHECGVLSAPPGSGKTVMACALMAERQVPTLILVHRQPLLEQWKERISEFLRIPPKEIGIHSGTKKKLTGMVDIASILSLKAVVELEDLFANYEQVIIDECHHIPSVTFESIVKRSSARFVVGLTATPYRKDGYQKILFMECGPVRHKIKEGQDHAIKKRVVVRETPFMLPEELGERPPLHQVWDQLTRHLGRLNIIANDAVDSVKAGRFPLVISDRVEHLLSLKIAVKELDPTICTFTLEGSMGKKGRKLVMEEMKQASKDNAPVCLFATASLIGEGVDIPRLDTLILGMPISFKGRLVQYAGRLHRPHEGKKDVVIYDYLDTCSGLTVSMHRKRLLVYKTMGYQIDTNERTKSRLHLF